MDHYSQPHLKKAATEPEHVIRKAEFDIAVESLDERIVVIEKTLDGRPVGPSVVPVKPPLETVEASDTLESPRPNPVSEAISMSAAAAGIKLFTVLGSLNSEQIAAVDTAEAPQASPLLESSVASDVLESVMPTTYRSEIEPENVSLMEKVQSPQPPKERIMENSHIQGEIEVVVEDKNGEIKSRQTITNTITDGFLRYAFYDMLNGGTLSSVLRSNTRAGYNLLSRTVPSSLGIYALDRNIDIRNDTFLPPYLTGDLNSLDPGVVFYNVGGTATEDSQVMIPVDQRCFFDHTKRELVVEYVKNTGFGIVKSVCVGRSHLLKKEMYSVTQTETAVSNQWTATGVNYLVEHHATAGSSL
ncbi:MAG TPA: hypothetical protein DEB39_12175 [Planctomycetaceae bacterium]|nr:hypothetical protein [Planctomycetaceae bacterium]